MTQQEQSHVPVERVKYKIKWPDPTLPPINLWTVPTQGRYSANTIDFHSSILYTSNYKDN